MTAGTAHSSLSHIAVAAVDAMATGTRRDLEQFIAADAVNREAVAEPPECRVPGPDGFFATAQWLRDAYSDLAFEIHEVLADGDLVAVHCTMRGHQTGVFVTFTADGDVAQAFAPTNKSFAVTHTHWLRFRDGQVIEHWANRDDIGQAVQLGWVPPSPRFIVRCALAKRAARRNRRKR